MDNSEGVDRNQLPFLLARYTVESIIPILV